LLLKQAVFTVARSAGLPAAARKASANQLRILCYHGIWITPGYQFGDCTFMPPEQFERRMARLKSSGHPILPLAEAVDRLADGTLPEAAVAITIDDGWVSTLTHMLPVLEAHSLPATLYATTWYAGRELPVVNVAVDYLRSASNRMDIDASRVIAEIGALAVDQRLEALRAFGRDLGVDEAWLELRQFNIMSAEELAEAHGRGLDVQLHTHRHIDVRHAVDTLPYEIRENRKFLESALGEVRLAHFCYPSGTNHPKAAELLAASGVKSATLVDEGLNPPGTSPFALRRFLDGRGISDAVFDAYLSGMLHYTHRLRHVLRRRAA